MMSSAIFSTFPVINSIGHGRRLRRLFHASDMRSLILPIDHGATFGPVSGLADLETTLKLSEYADALMIRPAQLRRLSHPDHDRVGLIVCLTGRLLGGVDHTTLNSVSEAVRGGADAVGLELKLGSEGELENAALVSALAEEAHILGLPVLITIYAQPSYLKEVGPFAHAHACRAAEELGADLVKTALPDDDSDIRACLDGVAVPVFLAGGGRTVAEVTDHVARAVSLGAAGAAIGRSAWGNDTPEEAMKGFRRAIHDQAEGQ